MTGLKELTNRNKWCFFVIGSFLQIQMSLGLSLNNSNAQPSNWELLVVNPFFKFQTIDLKSGESQFVQTKKNKDFEIKWRTSGKRISSPKCIDANNVKHWVLCRGPNGNTVFDFTSGKAVWTNLKVFGYFDPKANYIIDQQGKSIFDIKNKKYISAIDPYWPSKQEARLHAKPGQGIALLSKIRGNGDCKVAIIDEQGKVINTENQFNVNVYTIIQNKGKGFQINKNDDNTPFDSSKLSREHRRYYIGNGQFLIPLYSDHQKQNWKISKVSSGILTSKANLLNTAGICDVTPDASWAVCWVPKEKGSKQIRPVIYNIKLDKIVYEKNFTGKIFWLWLGKTEHYPGYLTH